ncbi:unnamed protein product [Moneuplotes crassus]|uniref:Uncharacterized protein n=1 Tax=Euplotes crassus TaxID=5936 RepID=A0AAD2D765_EUPCR|nr:unnamed protein product [Moneuplotes crassus]
MESLNSYQEQPLSPDTSLKESVSAQELESSQNLLTYHYHITPFVYYLIKKFGLKPLLVKSQQKETNKFQNEEEDKAHEEEKCKKCKKLKGPFRKIKSGFIRPTKSCPNLAPYCEECEDTTDTKNAYNEKDLLEDKQSYLEEEKRIRKENSINDLKNFNDLQKDLNLEDTSQGKDLRQTEQRSNSQYAQNKIRNFESTRKDIFESMNSQKGFGTSFIQDSRKPKKNTTLQKEISLEEGLSPKTSPPNPLTNNDAQEPICDWCGQCHSGGARKEVEWEVIDPDSQKPNIFKNGEDCSQQKKDLTDDTYYYSRSSASPSELSEELDDSCANKRSDSSFENVDSLVKGQIFNDDFNCSDNSSSQESKNSLKKEISETPEPKPAQDENETLGSTLLSGTLTNEEDDHSLLLNLSTTESKRNN